MTPPSTLQDPLPSEPIDRLVAPLDRFLHVEATGGIVLLACTVIALAIANSPLSEIYSRFWHTEVALEVGTWHLRFSLEHWINDGLMVLFFFVIGLEVKRELVRGELRDLRSAALPLAGALGGMVVPAAMYLVLIGPGPAVRGWGVPMATDIAFVVASMAMLGTRVPSRLRVMLLSLAIADDIGAILVIALGYSAGIAVVPLLLGLLGIGVVWVCERLGVRSFGVYTLLGVAIWVAFVKSGVHATIAGVLLGLLTPAMPYISEGTFAQFVDRLRAVWRGGGTTNVAGTSAANVRTLQRVARETVSPLDYLESVLHPWVSFAIMPVFALANVGVRVHMAAVGNRVAVAVAVSLLLGKPLGITLVSWLAVHLGLARQPAGVSWLQLTGGAALCGIGFTMAMFIASLALDSEALPAAKVGILAASALASVLGLGILSAAARRSS